MNVNHRERGACRPAPSPVSLQSPLPLLARLSGRDRETLAQCPSDAIAQSCSLGAVLVVAALLHAAGVLAALVILNVPLELAAVVASITATGLFAMDRIAVNALDTVGAERALRRVGATDLPTLTSRWHGAISVALRNLFSVFTAVFVGSALVLHFYANDAAQDLARRQIVIDAPFFAEAALLDSEQAALGRALAQEEDATAQHAEWLAECTAARQAQEASTVGDVTRAGQALDALQAGLRNARAESAQHRDRMRCEHRGGGEDCPGATGRRGMGDQYYSAKDRAKAAEGSPTFFPLERVAAIAIQDSLESSTVIPCR